MVQGGLTRDAFTQKNAATGRPALCLPSRYATESFLSRPWQNLNISPEVLPYNSRLQPAASATISFSSVCTVMCQEKLGTQEPRRKCHCWSVAETQETFHLLVACSLLFCTLSVRALLAFRSPSQGRETETQSQAQRRTELAPRHLQVCRTLMSGGFLADAFAVPTRGRSGGYTRQQWLPRSSRPPAVWTLPRCGLASRPLGV